MEPQKIDLSKLPDPIDLSNLPDKTETKSGHQSPLDQNGVWDKLNTPLTTKPTEIAHDVAQKITEHHEGESPTWSMIKGFGAGMGEGVGNLLSSLTSPLGIATSLVGGGEYTAGKAGLTTLARMLGLGTKALSVPYAVHGAGKILDPESTIAERLQGVGEAAGGAAGMLHTPMAKTAKLGSIAEDVKTPPKTKLEYEQMMRANPDKFTEENIAQSLLAWDKAESSGLIKHDPVETKPIETPIEPSVKSEPVTTNEPNESAQLPPDLRRASPFYSMGKKLFKPVFESDLDKSKFIIAQTKRSPRDADYLKFVMEQTGMDERSARIDAIEFRNHIKQSILDSGLDGGEVKIPSLSKGPTVMDEAGKTIQPNNEPTVVHVKKPNPDLLKTLATKGYVFDSMRDDGAFKFVKSPITNPSNTPIVGPSSIGKIGDSLSGKQTETNNIFGSQNPDTLQNPLESATGRLENSGGLTPPPPVARLSEAAEQPNGKPSGKPKTDTHPITEVLNFPRAVMASIDLSAPLRQGLPLWHKPAYRTALMDMFKAWGSEDSYKAINHSINDMPIMKPKIDPATGKVGKSFAEEAGLSLSDLNSLSAREEHIMNTWAEKIPGVRASNRAYTAFLNKLRVDTFQSLIEDSVKAGADVRNNLPAAKALAEFVNNATGRGSLKIDPIRIGKFHTPGANIEGSATLLNSVLFSPRLMASRVKLFNPATYIMSTPQARMEALKSFLAVSALGNTVLGVGKMAGGSIESDPASSDFMKLKLGNTRIDPWGGFQQYLVAPYKILSGRSVSTTTDKESDLDNPKGPYGQTRLDVSFKFLRSKLNPVMGFVWSMFDNMTEANGKKMDMSNPNPFDNAIGQRFIPMMMQDLYAVMQDDPSLLPVTFPASLFGMGVNTYESK